MKKLKTLIACILIFVACNKPAEETKFKKSNKKLESKSILKAVTGEPYNALKPSYMKIEMQDSSKQGWVTIDTTIVIISSYKLLGWNVLNQDKTTDFAALDSGKAYSVYEVHKPDSTDSIHFMYRFDTARQFNLRMTVYNMPDIDIHFINHKISRWEPYEFNYGYTSDNIMWYIKRDGFYNHHFWVVNPKEDFERFSITFYRDPYK